MNMPKLRMIFVHLELNELCIKNGRYSHKVFFIKWMVTSQICRILLDKEKIKIDTGNISPDNHLVYRDKNSTPPGTHSTQRDKKKIPRLILLMSHLPHSNWSRGYSKSDNPCFNWEPKTFQEKHVGF